VEGRRGGKGDRIGSKRGKRRKGEKGRKREGKEKGG